MIAQDTEFQISQYIDGTQSAAERSAIESVLASDAEARKVLADYRQLDRHLVASQSVPLVHWDKLANVISGSIERQAELNERPMIAGRIGFWSARMRIAASVLVILGTATIIGRHYRQTAPSTPVVPVQTDVAVQVPGVEAPAGPATVEVSVYPSATAMRNDPAHYASVNRPPKVAISPVKPPAKQDSH